VGFPKMEFPNRENLMADISRSCDLPKMKNVGLMAYVNRTCDLPKKENFDGLYKHFLEARILKFSFFGYF